MLNPLLKRQSLALHYIKKQLTSPQPASGTQDSSDEEESGRTMVGGKDSANARKSPHFEEGLPTSNFL